MITLRTQQEIIKMWRGDISNPIVSICCTTYNHEKFIEDCIKGFLIQETNFPFEILIYDDASTDKTPDIIKEYEKKYPDIIKPICQSENQFSKGIKPNPTFNFPRAKGKYIALCEGDDYWTDPFKLQKQVDFLENNPDYVICYHDSIIIDDKGNIIRDSKLSEKYKRDYNNNELIKGYKILLQTMCFRNVINNYPWEHKIAFGGDVFITSLLGRYGKGKYLNNVKPSVWRMHNGGINSGIKNDREKFHKHLTTAIALYLYYLNINDYEKAEYFLFEKIFQKLKNKDNRYFKRFDIIDYNKLNAFLHLGYLPVVSSELIDHLLYDINELKNLKKWASKKDEKILVKEGSIILNNIFKELIEKCPNKIHIVPLSGGLDSRAILSFLIKFGLRDKIITFTFGIPGTYDYEIGKKIAKFAKVKNISLNLNKITLEEEDLLYTITHGAEWTPLTSSYYNRLSIKVLGEDNIFWSGFLGGAIAGNHYRPGYERLSWDEAKKTYWDSNKWEKSSNIYLTEKNFDFNVIFPITPIIDNANLITYPEQLDLCIMQTSWLKKSIVNIAPQVITPFAHKTWIKFMLSLSFEHRHNCSLYKKILINSFPEYYSLPTKNLNGKPLINTGNYWEFSNKGCLSWLFKKNVDKMLNYIDYNDAYRNRKDFIELAKKSVLYLKEMEIIPWLDPVDLWKKHLNGEINIWRSLEIFVTLYYMLNYNNINIKF